MAPVRALLARFLLALALVLVPAYGLPAWAEADSLNQPKDVTAVTVTNAATKLMASPDPGRRHRGVFIQPTDGDIYVGGPSVTTATGFFLPDDTIMFVEWTTGDRWYAIRAGGSNVNVRVVPVF